MVYWTRRGTSTEWHPVGWDKMTIQLMWQYWEVQNMSTQVTRYYRDAFGALHGIAQGDPL